MNQPRPESRISSLEQRASTLEALMIELSSDAAEELKAIRQDIKQLGEGITASYKVIGDTFIATWDDTKATLATKDDISKLETRLDTMATKDDVASLKDDVASIKTTQEQILTLLQQRKNEE